MAILQYQDRVITPSRQDLHDGNYGFSAVDITGMRRVRVVQQDGTTNSNSDNYAEYVWIRLTGDRTTRLNAGTLTCTLGSQPGSSTIRTTTRRLGNGSSAFSRSTWLPSVSTFGHTVIDNRSQGFSGSYVVPSSSQYINVTTSGVWVLVGDFTYTPDNHSMGLKDSIRVTYTPSTT